MINTVTEQAEKEKGSYRLHVNASDGGFRGLALANGWMAKRTWCRCETSSGSAYYIRPSGGHGWACMDCLGIVQLG